MNIIEQIDSWSKQAPDRLAHVSGDKKMTYLELTQRSNTLAAALAQTLPNDHSPIAVLGHKEPEMLIAFLACIKAGHAYVPIDTVAPEQRIQMIMENSKAVLCLTPEKVREMEHDFAGMGENFVNQIPEMDAAWYIMFTSGSTGNPKGVVITRGCLETFIAWVMDEQNYAESGDVFLNQVPFSFDVSVMDTYSSLICGGTLFSVTKDQIAEPKLLFDAFAESQISFWVSTPSFAQLCLAEPAFSDAMLPRVHTFWLCGETLAPEVAADLLKRFPRAELWNTYGPTEATVATTSIKIDQDILARYSPLPVGKPKPNSQILIVPKEGENHGEGRGEIVIVGEHVSPGYLHRPDLTAKSFYEVDHQRAYRTGDLGHIQDGLVFCDGRIDFQIKLHGYRIEIGDIEANLKTLDTVKDALVIPKLKDGKAEYLTAFVILKDQNGGSNFEITRGLKRALGERLPEYMIPRKFIFLAHYPMTTNGKADRRQLAESVA